MSGFHARVASMIPAHAPTSLRTPAAYAFYFYVWHTDEGRART